MLAHIRCFALALVACLTAAAAVAAPQTWRPDELIVMRIQIALFSAPEIDPESIVVQSEDGVVKVTGVVPTADVKARLEQMIRDAEGVRTLNSALTVDAASGLPKPNPQPPDDMLRGEVTSRLDDAPELNDSEIEIRSISGGTVVLSGFAKSLEDQLRALRLAKGVAGVRFVQNDMKTPTGAVHDLELPSSAAAGGDAANRREQQALDGRAAETPPVVPGAPTPPRTQALPGAPDANVEGHSH